MTTSLQPSNAPPLPPVDRRKGSTPVSTLRRMYGADFLRNWPASVRLSAIQAETEMSLTELLRQYRMGKL